MLLGVPSSAGAQGPGVELAVAALRESGLAAALRAVDRDLEDRGHLSLFPFRDDAAHPKARNLSGVACAAQAVLDELVGCGADVRPFIVGGGCSLLPGAVAAVARLHGHPPGIVFLDAHADLNTPATSPSGCLDGMALSLALGRGPSSLDELAGPVGWTLPEHVALLGFRELDPGERDAVPQLGLALAAPAVRERPVPEIVASALAVAAGGASARPVVVHLDLDVYDPAELQPKVGGPPGPGLTGETLVGILQGLWGAPDVAALLITGFDPGQDPTRASASRIIDLLARTFRAGQAERL